jgi:hypothetical protein
MAFGMYAASIPVYQRQLTAISKVLDKAQVWATAKKVDETVLLGTRMIPDMLPLSRQVMIACRFAEESVARLAGAEVPKAPEANEKNLADLKARIAAVMMGISACKPEQIDGTSPCRTSISIARPLTQSCGRRASRSGNGISSAVCKGFRRPCAQRPGVIMLGLSAVMCITARQPGGPDQGRRFCFIRRLAC